MPTWCSLQFFYVAVFLLLGLVTGANFRSLSVLVLELLQFLLMQDWPEIQKLQIPPSEYWSISDDWTELGILNLAQMSLMKSYWMLQNARATVFTVSEILRKNQQDGKTTTPTQFRVKVILILVKLQIWRAQGGLGAFNSRPLQIFKSKIILKRFIVNVFPCVALSASNIVLRHLKSLTSNSPCGSLL